jgi:hypothetical protein
MCRCNINHGVLTEGLPEFDLVKEFHEANKTYFDGKLQLSFELAYKTKANSFGWVRAKHRSRGRRILSATVLGLYITSKYKLTREQFLSTFLHEMIHVYMLQHAHEFSWQGGYHGWEWQRMADQISKQSGVPITKEESSADYEHSEPIKEYIAIIKLDKNAIGDRFMATAMYTASMWKKYEAQVYQGIERYKEKYPHLDVYVIKTNDPELIKYGRFSRQDYAQFYLVPKDKVQRVIDIVKKATPIKQY